MTSKVDTGAASTKTAVVQIIAFCAKDKYLPQYVCVKYDTQRKTKDMSAHSFRSNLLSQYSIFM